MAGLLEQMRRFGSKCERQTSIAWILMELEAEAATPPTDGKRDHPIATEDHEDGPWLFGSCPVGRHTVVPKISNRDPGYKRVAGPTRTRMPYSSFIVWRA